MRGLRHAPRAIGRLGFAALALALLGADAPVRDDREAPPAARPARVVVPSGNLHVYADISLVDPLNEIAGYYELTRTAVKVVSSFGGSAELRGKIEQGAGADIFMAADSATVGALVRGGICDSVRVVARGRLVLIGRKAGPVDSLAELGMPGVRVVICAPDDPAGRYAERMLQDIERARGFGKPLVRRIRANLVGRVAGTRAAVTAVANGEADAAFAYESDLGLSRKGKLVRVWMPDTLAVPVVYGAAIVRQGALPVTARDYLDLLSTDRVRATFTRRGFLP